MYTEMEIGSNSFFKDLLQSDTPLEMIIEITYNYLILFNIVRPNTRFPCFCVSRLIHYRAMELQAWN